MTDALAVGSGSTTDRWAARLLLAPVITGGGTGAVAAPDPLRSHSALQQSPPEEITARDAELEHRLFMEQAQEGLDRQRDQQFRVWLRTHPGGSRAVWEAERLEQEHQRHLSVVHRLQQIREEQEREARAEQAERRRRQQESDRIALQCWLERQPGYRQRAAVGTDPYMFDPSPLVTGRCPMEGTPSSTWLR